MSATPASLVPLESGDRLTRAEFHRRYCARPDIKKAELIDGVVYVSSPVSALHGEPHGEMVGWLYAYAAITPGVKLMVDTTVYLPGENEVQPDACLFRVPAPEGGARLTEEHYIQGAPPLIVEIAASSASPSAGPEGEAPQTSNYLHDKLEAYLRSGVREYVVRLVYDKRIDWFRLRDGRYVRVEPDERGVIESTAFPGLRLAVAKMLAGDQAGVLAELLVTGQNPGAP